MAPPRNLTSATIMSLRAVPAGLGTVIVVPVPATDETLRKAAGIYQPVPRSLSIEFVGATVPIQKITA